jgi:hypothetical protein
LFHDYIISNRGEISARAETIKYQNFQDSRIRSIALFASAISLSHDDEYPPFLGGIQFSLTNADN